LELLKKAAPKKEANKKEVAAEKSQHPKLKTRTKSSTKRTTAK